jgi:hypothetical protein
LESFVKHNAVKEDFGASRQTEAVTDEHLAVNLSDYAQRCQAQGSQPSRHFQTFNENSPNPEPGQMH